VVASEDGRINVWDVETQEPIDEWAGNTGRILSPDDQLTAIGDDDGKIVIREMKARERRDQTFG
jgi:WD40 repeat protein